MKLRLLMVGILCLMNFSYKTFAQVEVKDKSFYIDGQKFFVKGIGYEGILPGQSHRVFNPELLRFDMQRILSAGFNTIRTWGAFTEQELEVLKEHDVKIIMGIWIDPAGNFTNQQFVNNAKGIVGNVLNYSKNYDNIIAYIIMNEPMVSVVLRDYKSTVNLWQELMDIIHTQHPGRPVSIANTPNGTYIDSKLFDFSAYNAYIYNPVTINYLHEYRGYIDYLQQMNASGGPLIITEYGLPVSPTGPGQWGYGGNTQAEQRLGNLHMYKALVDGGAYGACIFNYTDGWWKAGDEWTHNDSPEEWYGLIEYTSIYDTRGIERQAWKAVSDYQSAIITQPRSEEIYINKVPVEIFFNDNIKKMEILLDNKVIYQYAVENKYFTDTLQIPFDRIKDAKLIFNCYNTDNDLIKSEEKSILITSTEISLPDIHISINDNCWQIGLIKATYSIVRTDGFTVSPTLDYVYYPHVGFDYGQKFKANINGQDQISKTHPIAGNVDVFTIGAAFDITYGGFKKRIFNQLTLTNKDLNTGIEENIYPDYHSSVYVFGNPYSGFLTLIGGGGLELARVEVIGMDGQILAVYQSAGSEFTLPVSGYAKGIYLLRVYDAEGKDMICKVSI